MESVKVERLDHLGVIAGVIKELGIIEKIDECIGIDDQEEISSGEAVAGMIINGLGFSNRPISLTPQFFENKPIEILFRGGVKSEHFNRFKLGRSLEKINNYGCDIMFSEIAMLCCQQEKIGLRFNSLDTTSFSVTGEYLTESDEHTIELTHGYSKDHRPDLKQAVLELMVSQDGGVPFVSKSWDGNASDNDVFKARSQELIEVFSASETSRYLIADSKLYTQENAENLAKLLFITRIPGTLKVEKQLKDQALVFADWKPIDDTYSFQKFDLCHYGIEQRWIVVYSKAALKRAEKTLNKARIKENEVTQKALFHLQAKRFDSKEQAQKALREISDSLKYHQVSQWTLNKKIQYAKRGKPTADTPIKAVHWQIRADISPNWEKIRKYQQQKACFVLGTNIPEKELTDQEVFNGYKGQTSIEQSFGFLKDPVFFVSSLFVKKPCRIQGLLMVMTTALLVYSIAQRRMRNQLNDQAESIPNQIGQPTEKPTLRWVFQLLEGINRIIFSIQGQLRVIIEGLTNLRMKILQLFEPGVCQIYQTPWGSIAKT